MVLEYVKVLLSWPVVIAALVAFFLWRFGREFSTLISSVSMIKFRGTELELRQAVRNADEPAIANRLLTSDAEPEPARDAERRLQSAEEQALLWEYRFLNYFLVPRSQLVLEWLASREPMTYGAYDAHALPFIRDAAERSAIIVALENHHLVLVNRAQGNLITVTKKGRDYLQWRGPLPQPTPPPPPAPPASTE